MTAIIITSFVVAVCFIGWCGVMYVIVTDYLYRKSMRRFPYANHTEPARH